MPYERARSRLAKHRLQDILRSDRDRGRDAQSSNDAKPVEAPAAPTKRPRQRLSGTCDEPIRTRSMARLLASQGQHERALAIYEALAAADAADATLLAELEAVRAKIESVTASVSSA
jgi:hypothetical protein